MNENSAAPVPRDKRILWIDAAKGFAIVLVVFGHVLGGILTRDWLATNGPWRVVYDYLYLFHMPVFFMISGLLLYEAARSRPLEALVSRIGSVVWPYLLWDVVVRWSLLPFIGRYMGTPPGSVSALHWFGYAMMGYLSWFFWTLFLVQVLFILLARVPASILLVTSIVLSLLLYDAKLGTLQYLIEYMPFLLVGAASRPYLDKLKIEGTPLELAVALLVFAAMAVAAWQGWISLRPVRMICNIAGIFAAIALVQCFPRSFQGGTLARLGAASLVIYVLHPYFQGATRNIVASVVGNAPYLQLGFQTLFAIGGPLIAWAISERVGASWLFRLPLSLSRRRVAPA